jgi:multimeric flavodoxin WrbA
MKFRGKTMRVLTLNGSPHGNNGVTAQYIKYLEIKFPKYTFKTIEVARKIKNLEKDTDFFNEVLQQINNADAIIWAFPVYTMLVPSQLKLFIELLFQRNGKKVLEGKIATGISTSANFYDHTTHDYVHGISTDLGLRYVRGFSAEMKDILFEEGRNNFLGFAKDFFWKVNENNIFEDRTVPAIKWEPSDLSKITLPKVVEKTGDKKIVIVSDANPEDANLLKMIELFEIQVSHKVERIEIKDTNIKGGCIGCLRCGNGDACFYKDEYAEAFKKVQNADVVIYAGAIKDRYFSARFKKFIDRYFSNGHRHVLKAGLFGYIVSGPLNQLASMRETLEANIEIGRHQRLGIVSDEHSDPNVTANNIKNTVQFLEHWIKNTHWQTSPTFLGVGGHKIFRDLVYENRGVMCADYRFYKEKGLLDFPNRSYFNRFVSKILLIVQRIPAMQKEFKKNINNNRLKPYRKMLEKVE